MSSAQSRFTARLLTALTLVGCLLGTKHVVSQQWKPDIPRTWDDAALADWATPVAGLNVRPTHMTAKEYYALPTENLRSYPVYVPDREPRGYWEMLQRVGPKPLIEPDARWTETDWITAGRRVFDELDHLALRTLDPKWIAAARSAVTFDSRTMILPTGEIFGMRWVPTSKGVALSFSNCSGCHGGNAIAGPLPDLRYASTATLEGIEDIVLNGKRATLGMPSFRKILNAEQVHAIQAYIVSRARESAAGTK